MIDLQKAKNRLKEIQEQGTKKDYSKLSYSLKLGENTLRFIPRPGDDWPFLYGEMYYKIKKQYFISPRMYDEPDPILLALDDLMKTNVESNVNFAKKHFPSRRVFALAVVRSQEENGAVWVDFPQKVEKLILNFIFNGEYIELQKEKFKAAGIDSSVDAVDITNEQFGMDFTITKTKGGASGFPEYEVKPTKLTMPFSKLAKTDAEIEKILTNTPDFKDAYKHLSYEDMKTAWDKYLSGEEESNVKETTTTEEPVVEEKIDINAVMQKFKNKKLG